MNLNDIIGKKFERLTVLKLHHSIKQNDNKHYFRFYLCQCECGNTLIVKRSSLISGNTKSCGCYKKEICKSKVTKHGFSKTKIYKVWCHIKERCYNPNSKDFKDYGFRNIKMCDEWLNNPQKFCEWAIKNGYKKGLSIDRIDVNGNYEPSNCRWVSNYVQNRNKRTSNLITYNGETLCLTDWAKKYNINEPTLFFRLKKGWTIEKALLTPVRKMRYNRAYK